MTEKVKFPTVYLNMPQRMVNAFYFLLLYFSLARQNLNLSNDTMAVAEQITFPYLILHGDDDQLCSVEGSKMLHAKTNSEDKTMKVRRTRKRLSPMAT